MEVRYPDPACNPYLAFAVMLASGLDGIERGQGSVGVDLGEAEEALGDEALEGGEELELAVVEAEAVPNPLHRAAKRRPP